MCVCACCLLQLCSYILSLVLILYSFGASVRLCFVKAVLRDYELSWINSFILPQVVKSLYIRNKKKKIFSHSKWIRYFAFVKKMTGSCLFHTSFRITLVLFIVFPIRCQSNFMFFNSPDVSISEQNYQVSVYMFLVRLPVHYGNKIVLICRNFLFFSFQRFTCLALNVDATTFVFCSVTLVMTTEEQSAFACKQ